MHTKPQHKNKARNIQSRSIIFAFIFQILLSGIASAVDASSWAVLPVKNYSGDISNLTTGPSLPGESEKNSWELAKMMRLYLLSGQVYEVLPMARVEEYYKSRKMPGIRKLSVGDLSQIAQEVDADKLLLTSIHREGDQFRIVSQVYYRHSQIIGDQIAIKGDDFWLLLGQSAEKRFPKFRPLPNAQNRKMHFIAGIDAQGKNYREVQQLANLTQRLTISLSSVFAMNGHQEIFEKEGILEKEELASYIRSIHSAGTDLNDNIYPVILRKLLEAAQASQTENVYTVLLVSGAPQSDEARKVTNQLFRRIQNYSHLLVLGAGTLDQKSINYWHDLAAEHNTSRQLAYENIHYLQKFGLSTGHSVYIFQSGRALYESNKDKISGSHQIDLKKEDTLALHPDKIEAIYEKVAYSKVVSSGEVTIQFDEILLNFTNQMVTFVDKKGESVRVLIEIDANPFWVSIPKQIALDPSGRLALQQENNTYLLLNIIPKVSGNVFNNQEDFAKVIPFEETPSGLVLPLQNYLSDPGKYLGHSIGGGSLYIVSGKIKMIRAEPQRY